MRQFLEHVTGLSIYPLISFVLFGSFFIGMLIWLFTERKQYFTEMEALPLSDNTTSNKTHA